MIAQQTITAFTSGTENVLPDEVISKDAASDSLNWLTINGRVELSYGRQAQGGSGAAGKNYGEHVGYRADGTSVRFRKVDSVIQTLVGSVWTDVITGLTVNADYVFSNYQSLAGAFTYIFGIDGIYKIATANPTSYSSLYNSTKNFKGFGIIDKARTLLWGRAEDPTGLYGSYIDAQNATVYTTVSGEATASLGGTLAFKAGGATRTAFGVAITLTVSGEVYRDNYNGVLTGTLGGTGTINYTSGVYTLSNAGIGTATYQWEDSNAKGITDFTHTATRLAGEGFVIRQDAGGDAIVVVIPLDGSYFSLKKHSCYRFALDSTDLAPINEIFRTDIGIPSLRAATATGEGIMFLNTANPSKPRLWILKQNVLGDTFDVKDLFPKFNFALFTYNDCLLDFWDRYVIVGCAYQSSLNNRLLLCDVQDKTVDTTYYGIRTSCKDQGILYGGDVVSKTTFELFTGFDDLGINLMNYWESKGELYGSNVLKKVRHLRLKGQISQNQSLQVYLSLDSGDYFLVGTVLGNGDYVDYGSSSAIGTSLFGGEVIGGNPYTTVANYFIDIKVKTGKFRKRMVKLVAGGIGYVSANYLSDFDIWTYEERMPRSYRVKQNVALAGTPTDMDNPQF